MFHSLRAKGVAHIPEHSTAPYLKGGSLRKEEGWNDTQLISFASSQEVS